MPKLARFARAMASAWRPSVALAFHLEPSELEGPASEATVGDAALARKNGIVIIRESVLGTHRTECGRVVAALKRHGMSLMIDELGAGESNIRAIADLEPSYVRIDRALLATVRTAERSRRLVTSLAGLCRALDARTVARVHGAAELDSIISAGVDIVCGVDASLLATRCAWRSR